MVGVISSTVHNIAWATGLTLDAGGVVCGIGIEFGKLLFQLALQLCFVAVALVFFILSLWLASLDFLITFLHDGYGTAGSIALVACVVSLMLLMIVAAVRRVNNGGSATTGRDSRVAETNRWIPENVRTSLDLEDERSSTKIVLSSATKNPPQRPDAKNLERGSKNSRTAPSHPTKIAPQRPKVKNLNHEKLNPRTALSPPTKPAPQGTRVKNLEHERTNSNTTPSPQIDPAPPDPELQRPGVERGSSGVGIFDSYDQQRYKDYLTEHTDDELLRQLDSKEGKMKYSVLSAATSVVSSAVTGQLPWGLILTARKRKVNKRKLMDIREELEQRGLKMDGEGGGWVKAGAKVAGWTGAKVGAKFAAKEIVKHVIA